MSLFVVNRSVKLLQDSLAVLLKMEKTDSPDNKFSFKLFLRIRPQKNGKTDVMDYLTVKDSKHLHLTVPEDSVV